MDPFFIYKRLFIFLLLLAVIIPFSTNSQINIPPGINSWKPSHLIGVPHDGPGSDSVVRTDFTITMSDGVIIDALKYVPVREFPPAGGYPTVIMVHGYGDNKNTLAGFCHDQATYGYYTMTYSVRGQGASGGVSNLISRLEANDLIQIVNWVKADSINGSNPSKILIMGGSQGGAIPLMAACMGGLNVAAIINSVAPPNFASSWIENGSIKMTLLWTIEYTPDTARYNGQVNRMSDWIYADNKQYWDSLAYWLPIDRDFTNILPNCTVPVLVEGAWQDKFFNADGWMQNIDKITSPMSSYLGAVRGHGADVSPTEDIWHMEWFNNWFFEWLWGMHTPILDQAKYQYATTSFPVVNNYFTFTHDSSNVLLRNITTPVKMYLNKNGKLKNTPQPLLWLSFLNNKVSSGYTLQQAVYDEFTGSNFNSKFKVDSLKFTSEPLTNDADMLGSPVVKINYLSTANTFVQLNYQIYEVLPTGERRFVNRANYTDRNYSRFSLKQATFRGQAHAHKFKAGSKIQVIITNLDRAHTDASFFTTNPFVLPVMKNGLHTLILNSSSYIELPVKSASLSKLNFLFSEDGKDVINEEPYKFSLLQNYPNPFNPNTMIEYSVAGFDKVELKVYDILGREVAVLVNETKSPGSYRVLFNGQNLSSGIYFYMLKSGSYTDVKKMTLIK